MADRGVQPAFQQTRWWQTANYLAATETHTFAASVAAHALLSFFPFVVLLLSITRNVLHSKPMYNSLLALVGSYLPVSETEVDRNRSFIIANLRTTVEHHGKVQILSLVILMLACTGIFLPLEVALNRIWGAPRNRSYLRNWAVSLGLAFTCGVLGMLSASCTALTETYSSRLAHFLVRLPGLHLRPMNDLVDQVSVVLIRAGAIPFTIAVFFLIYWKLPNTPVPARKVLPAAITAGILWESSKYIYILLLPWLNFRDVYGPFAISVSLVLWAFVSALILLAGTEMVAVTVPEPPALALGVTSPLGLMDLTPVNVQRQVGEPSEDKRSDPQGSTIGAKAL